MRPPEELEAELVRTRRKLYQLTGMMTFLFIACLVVVFAAVGGALIIVDKRATRTLPADMNDAHQAKTAPHPQARAPATTAAASPAIQAASKPTSPEPPAAGSTGISAGTAQPAPLPSRPKPGAPNSIDVGHTASAHPGHDERSTVGAAPGDTAHRSGDTRERRRVQANTHTRARRREDQAVANAPHSQRVFVVDPPPQYRARRNDDQGPPQHDFFGNVFGGFFGNRGQ